MQLPIIQPGQPSAANPDSEPLIDRNRPDRSGWRSNLLFLQRLLWLTAILAALHCAVRGRETRSGPRTQDTLPLEFLKQLWPASEQIRPLGSSGLSELLDAQGDRIAILASTSPVADSIVGYSGPNNVLLMLAEDQSIASAHLISSGDTPEHASLVAEDSAFWQQFSKLDWNSVNVSELDSVSGATLTSLAILEAIEMRSSGRRLALKFPTDVSLNEARQFVDGASRIEAVEFHGYPAWQVLGQNVSGTAEEHLGVLVRTGYLVDSIEGYQGPSELLLWIDRTGNLVKVRLRGSYDNEPYVGYVRQEYSFWPLFQGRPLIDLAQLDMDAEGIEGVSGATMTSMAVAETVQAAATQLTAKIEAPHQRPVYWNWSWTECATAWIALGGLVLSQTRIRSQKSARLLWQVVCVCVLGMVAGNLLSVGLLAGWTGSGIPLRLAPGLSCLLLVALLAPIVLRTNVYCDQICPHGALQQWMRPVSTTLRKKSIRREGPLNTMGRLVRWGARGSSVAILLAAAAGLLFNVSLPLAWLEPFDSYSWRIGISVSLGVWVLSMAMGLWQPMSYCRLGCPTGQFLDWIRRSRRGRHAWRLDGCLALVAIVAWFIVGLRWLD